MDHTKMIFTIEQLTSTPAAKPHPTMTRVCTPNISRILWIDDSPLDHDQSDVISLDCTSLLECTQNILDIKDSEEYSFETSLTSPHVLNYGFTEHVQQQVNAKLTCEVHQERRRKEQLIFRLNRCLAGSPNQVPGDIHTKSSMRKVLRKIGRRMMGTAKQTTKHKTGVRSKSTLVFYPFVSSQPAAVVDISKELGLLNGKTFLNMGKKCTWC